MNKENNITVNQAGTENNSITSGSIPVVDEKQDYAKVSLKELIAKPEVQKVLRRYTAAPDEVIIKELRNPFENEDTKTVTQKVKVMSGTTIEDAVTHELTLVGTTLEPKATVNKKYRLIDYTFALEANMSAGKFGGYAAKGLKLMVTKLEEVK